MILRPVAATPAGTMLTGLGDEDGTHVLLIGGHAIPIWLIVAGVVGYLVLR